MPTAVVLFAIGLTLVASAATPAAQNETAATGRVRALEEAHAAAAARLQQLEQRVAELAATLPPSRSAPAPPPLPTGPIPLAGLRMQGRHDARVGIIEYSDFQCPYCGAFARQTLPVLTDRYVNRSLAQFGFWNLPLSEIHPQALSAAAAAECAGRQDRFWQFHDALFADQNHLDGAALVAHADRLGVDRETFGVCLERDGAAKVRQDLAAAKAWRISVTPTFVIGLIDGGVLWPKYLLVGARDTSAFTSVLDPLIAQVAQESTP